MDTFKDRIELERMWARGARPWQVPPGPGRGAGAVPAAGGPAPAGSGPDARRGTPAPRADRASGPA